MFDLGNFVQAGINWFGNELQNRRQADAAEAANAFSAQQYANRYRTTVSDMKAAGINPMLAYGSGPGNAPSGVQAQTTNSAAGVNESYNQSKLNAAQVELLKAQANQANSAADLARDQMSGGGLGKSTVELQSSSAAVNRKNLEVQDSTIAKIKEEIPLISRQASNTAQQAHVLTATVYQLEQQARLLKEQGNTQFFIQDQLRATVEKLITEVGLNKLDLQAADVSGNFGRISNEFRMVEQVLSDMVPNLGRVFGKPKKRGGWSTVERSDGKGNRSMETREWSEN